MAQEAVLDAVAEEVRRLFDAKPRSVLVVAAYHIGKERFFLGLAQRLGIQVRRRGVSGWAAWRVREERFFLGLAQRLGIQVRRRRSAGGAGWRWPTAFTPGHPGDLLGPLQATRAECSSPSQLGFQPLHPTRMCFLLAAPLRHRCGTETAQRTDRAGGQHSAAAARLPRRRTQVWCSAAKRRVLGLLGLSPDLMRLLTDDPKQARLHVSGWGLKPEQLQKRYLGPGEAFASAAAAADAGGAAAGSAGDGEAPGAGCGGGGSGGGASGAGEAAAAAAAGLLAEEGEEADEGEVEDGDGDSGGGGGGRGGGGGGRLLEGLAEEGGPPPPGGYEGEEEERQAAEDCAGQWQHVVGIRPTGARALKRRHALAPALQTGGRGPDGGASPSGRACACPDRWLWCWAGWSWTKKGKLVTRLTCSACPCSMCCAAGQGGRGPRRASWWRAGPWGRW